MNNLDSWRAFLRHVKTQEFIFGRGEAPLDPLPGLCRGGPLNPRPNLLFSKMTLLYHFIMKNLLNVTLDLCTLSACCCILNFVHSFYILKKESQFNIHFTIKLSDTAVSCKGKKPNISHMD